MGTEMVRVTKPVVGYRHELMTWLEARHEAGELVTPIETIRATPTVTDPEKFWFRVTVLEPRATPTARQRAAMSWRTANPLAKALVVAAAAMVLLSGAIFGLVQLVVHTVGAQTLRAGGGVLLILAVLAFAASAGRGKGRHSSHDGKGWHYTDCK